LTIRFSITTVVSEVLKAYANAGLDPRIGFFRDQAGHEVDLVVREGLVPIPVEVKSGATVASDFFRGLDYWNRLTDADPAQSWLVYGGDVDQRRSKGRVLGWRSLRTLKQHILDLARM
jgi:uncharacterized protein